MALGDRGIVERSRQADDDRVIRLVQRERVAHLGPDHLGPIDQPFRPQEPDRQLILVTGRSHRDGDGHGFLVGACRPDLQGRLADDPVRAHLQRPATHGHDRTCRDMADRR